MNGLYHSFYEIGKKLIESKGLQRTLLESVGVPVHYLTWERGLLPAAIFDAYGGADGAVGEIVILIYKK